MDCSLLGSSVHGIFQARILKQVAISYIRGHLLYPGKSPALAGGFFIISATWEAPIPLREQEYKARDHTNYLPGMEEVGLNIFWYFYLLKRRGLVFGEIEVTGICRPNNQRERS